MERKEGLDKLARSTSTLVVYLELHKEIKKLRYMKDIKNCPMFQVLIEIDVSHIIGCNYIMSSVV